MLLLINLSHVEEFLHFIDLVQEGFDIKILTKGRNLDLHPIFIRT